MIIVGVGLSQALEKSLAGLGSVRSCPYISNLERALSLDEKNQTAVIINTDMSDECVIAPKTIRMRGFTGAIVGLATLSDESKVLDVHAVDHEITFLKAGGDRLIWKPCSPNLVAEVIKAVMKRSGPCRDDRQKKCATPHPQRVHLWGGKFTMDVEVHSAHVQGVALKLTPTEFRILFHLASRPGVVYSPGALLDAGEIGDVSFRAINTHVKRIRDKLDRVVNTGNQLIQTVHGVGFKCSETCPF